MAKLSKRTDGRYEKTIVINGKKRHFYGKTQREAQQKAFTFQEKVERGVPFGEIAERFYDEYLIEHPSSERYIKAHYRRLVEAFGDEIAQDLTPKEWTMYLATIGDKSYKTVLGRKSVAQNIYRYGIVNFGLTENPVIPRMLPPSLEKGSRDIPPPEVLEQVKTRTDLPNALIFLMRLYTGMRRGELLRLQYKDVDLDKRLIHVTKSVYFVGNEPILKEPKTKAGTRDVILLKPLLRVLKMGKPNEYIFGGDKPWTARMIERRVENYQRGLGHKVTLHQLRHRYATILYEAGIDERMRMDLLGHANIQTTRDIYTHITARRKDSAQRQLDEFLEKVVNESSEGS